jgi:hypothetical protein
MNGETRKHRWMQAGFSIAASVFLFLALSPLAHVWAGDSDTHLPDDPSIVKTASAPWQATTSGDGLQVALDAIDLVDAAVDSGANVQIDGAFGLPGAATHIDTATDSSGDIYAVYEYLDGTNYDLIVAKSTDSGATWTLYSLGGSGNERHPAIAIDDSDYVLIAADYTSGSTTYPAFCKSANPGDIENWTCGYFSGLSNGSQNPAIATYGGGDTATIYMVWQYRSGSVYTLRYLYSADGGQNWTTAVFSPASFSRLYPAIALSNSGGTTYVSLAYQYDWPGEGDVYVINEVAGSNSWSTALTYTSGRKEAYPTLAASGSNVYFAYQYNQQNNDDDIYFRYSTNGGRSYNGSDVVIANTNRNERYPSLAARGTDVRAAYVHNGEATYLRLSTSAYGATWGDPYTMNDSGDSTEEGFRAVDVSYRYDAHPAVAWIDNRNSETDTDPYYATLNDDPLAPTQSTPFDNEKTADTTPEFTFSAADPDADTLSYQIQVDDDYDFGSPLVNRDSSADSTGFGGSDPYASGSDVTYTYQTSDPALSDGTTYYWRVRTKDLIGSWSDWSATWSFTIDTSDLTTAWFQTTQEQFDTGAHDETLVTAYGDVQLNLPKKTGSFTSPVIDITDFGGGAEWGEVYWADSEPNDTDLKIHVYYDVGGTPTIIPDGALPGNAAGFGGNFVDLTALDAGVYDKLYLRAELSTTDNKVTPLLHEWTIRQEDTGPSSQTVTLAISTSAGQRYTFGQTGATIEFPSDAPDAACTITVAVDRNTSVGDNVSRQYAIDTDCTGFSATLTLGYTQVELNGNDEDMMSLYRSHDGGSWQELLPSSRDTNANTLTVENVAEFSDWQIGDGAPTAVTLAAFTAEWDGDEVLVVWETALEINTVGFNLWRSTDPDGEYERVNAVLVPAESLGGVEGGSYEYADGDATPGVTYYYKLEEVEVGGARNWYGPVSTGAQAPTAVTISSFAAESPGSPALIWWLAVVATVVGVSGVMLRVSRRRA